jgi:tRNA (cytidine/uridine-2'-O-)-methyltransferase
MALPVEPPRRRRNQAEGEHTHESAADSHRPLIARPERTHKAVDRFNGFVLFYPLPMPQYPKLRCAPLQPPFNVVLVEPEIPPNTGAVARTCAATRSPLHLVEPLGFRIDDQAVRRAGLDYWHLVQLEVHASFEAFLTAHPDMRLHLLSSGAGRSYLEADFLPGDGMVFGRESVGLSREILTAHADRTWAVPTCGRVRSINLSNCVALVLYEALRRNGALSPTFLE